MRLLNLSAEPDGVIRSWLQSDLDAEVAVTLVERFAVIGYMGHLG